MRKLRGKTGRERARPEPGSVTSQIAESAEAQFGPRVWCSAGGEMLLLPSPIQRRRAPHGTPRDGTRAPQRPDGR